MIDDDADGNGVDARANGVDAHADVDADVDADGVDADAQAGILREIEERPLVNRLLPIGKKG